MVVDKVGDKAFSDETYQRKRNLADGILAGIQVRGFQYNDRQIGAMAKQLEHLLRDRSFLVDLGLIPPFSFFLSFFQVAVY